MSGSRKDIESCQSSEDESYGEAMVMYKCKKCDPCVTKKGKELPRTEPKKREGMR